MKRTARIIAGLLALALVTCGCAHRVQSLPETDRYYAAYGVEWPADASTNPAHYVTVEIDGRMVTTTLRRVGS